ncbi:MAG TPA: DUF2877 domain-containing protein [Aggregatilineales bacterium]|nr:DUF2877 domain-containing protein [Aggregatilineales bacterium]
MKIPVLVTTEYAQAWLFTAREIQILYQGDSVCIFMDVKQRILALVTPQIGVSPLNVVIPAAAFPCPRLDDLDFSIAQIWNPYPVWERLSVSPFFDVLNDVCRETYTPGCWSYWLLEAIPSLSHYQNLIYESAGEAIRKLLPAIADHREAECVFAVRQIAGMGEGLTPAGDDWLMGCILALHLLKKAALARFIAAAAIPLTTPLSAAYLRAAGEGACSIHWHRLLQATDVDTFNQAAVAIAQQGHTSGNSALAGFYVTLAEQCLMEK